MNVTELLTRLMAATHSQAFAEIYSILNEAPAADKGTLLEKYLEFLYKGNGWLVQRNAGKDDKGADLLLFHPDSPDRPTFIIQAKNHKSPLCFDDTRIELIKFEDQASNKYNCHNYELVCLNGYVENAWALADFNMALFDFAKIKSLISNYQEGNVTPSLELAAHNLQTSIKVRQQFIENRRVAVVQATGTGKSYIVGQALIDAMPHACVFLAPSHFILANQKKLLPWRDKVTYMTYAKAANFSSEDWLTINPQLIILDEFHRAGASVWGEGVKRLIDTCHNAKLLGTSATPIRFLDKQRNMVDELFESSVANEITLHDAIAKEILPNPLYVSGLYSLDETIAEYEQAISSCKATAAQKAQNLDDLKRIKIDWEKSSGIPQILNKHLEKLTGKYIVFCEDIDHLDEMQEEVSRWFRIAGKERKEMLTRTNYLIHSANTDAQNTEQLDAFEIADATKAVHILLSVNMLNEGLHIRHVNSVILLRKTTSPIIYLQQLGRCLQVGGGNKPIVFDLVSNINNLGAHSFQTGLNEALTKENTKREKVGLTATKLQLDINDETLEMMHQLERIENELGLNVSSFEFWYGLLEDFKKSHGNCKVPHNHKTADGFKLGIWVSNQRAKKETAQKEYTDRLDAIGFIWDVLSEQWDEGFNQLKAFVKDHGHCKVPQDHKTADGYDLGAWVSNKRTGKDTLPAKYKDRLNAIGFIWDPHTKQWEEGFRNLEAYVKEHGHCKVPFNHKTEDGFNLGIWINHQRKKKETLSKEYTDRLDALGFAWAPTSEQWEEGFRNLELFFKEHGHCKVPRNYKTAYGLDLGKWASRQRQKKDSIPKEYKDRLDALGFIWDVLSEQWEEGFRNLEAYVKEHGHCRVSKSYKTVDGFKLGIWVGHQRQKNAIFSKEYKDRLDALGFAWDVLSEQWEEGFRNLEAYVKEHGHCRVSKSYKTVDGFNLSSWVGYQRKKKETLSKEYKDGLEAIGFVFDPHTELWENGFRNLELFVKEHGHCKVLQTHKTADGFNLGSWVMHQRRKKETLSKEYKDRLNALGFVWRS